MRRRWRVTGVVAGMCVVGWLAPAAGAFTFTAAPGSPYEVSGAGAAAQVGDFNGDGLPDFLVTSVSPLNFPAQGQVFLAVRSEGFHEADRSVIGVEAVALGDFNGDGRLDVAEIPQRFDAGTTPPDLAVQLGNGDGTFAPSSGSSIQLGCRPYELVAADVNGDGTPDLLVVCDNDTLSVLLGNGDGTFRIAPGSPVALGAGTLAPIATGRFTGDGHLDLAVVNETQGTVSILLGNGDGTFTPAAGSPIAVGGAPSEVAVADFTGDGKQDLAVTDAPVGAVTVLLGRGDGSFTAAPGWPTTLSAQRLGRLTAADFNDDGKPDLAVDVPEGFDLLLSDGSGGFTLAHGSPFTQGSAVVASGTFDGRAGVIVDSATTQGVSVLLAAPASEGPTAALTPTTKRVTAGQRIELDASGSSDPLDRQLVDYRWDLGNGRFDHDTGINPTLNATFNTAGTMHVRVRVTNAAAEMATATATLVVHPAPRNAIVAGSVRVCTKARHRRCSTRAVRICRTGRRCVTSDRVEAVNTQTRAITVQRLTHGRFRLRLAPGHYSIRLLADGRHTRRRVLQRRIIEARAHHTAHVRFSFQSPPGAGTGVA